MPYQRRMSRIRHILPLICPKITKRLSDYDIIVFENDACIIKSYHGTDEVVTIPDRIEGKTVVGIGQYAFMGNKQIMNRMKEFLKLDMYKIQYLLQILNFQSFPLNIEIQ